jgi:hypothetical protein
MVSSVRAELLLRTPPQPCDESLNLSGRLLSNRTGWIESDEMSELPDFRSWAARVASQTVRERDDSEVLRLMSIAGYRERPADLEDWQRERLAAPEAKAHQRYS